MCFLIWCSGYHSFLCIIILYASFFVISCVIIPNYSLTPLWIYIYFIGIFLAGFVIGLFLSNENTVGPAIDLLALVLREASRDWK